MVLIPSSNACAVPLASRQFPERVATLVARILGVLIDTLACTPFRTSSIVTSAESAVPPFSVATTHTLPIASGVMPPSESIVTSGIFALTRQL